MAQRGRIIPHHRRKGRLRHPTTAGIAYISRLARRLTSVEEAPESFRSEAIKLGRILEREWLRRKH